MSTVTSADGTTIGYTREGQGPSLILVDGALCSRSFGPMPKLATRLAPYFTVYTYDRRGRGESGGTSPYHADREIEDIEALIQAAGGHAYVHGTSSGAVLALKAATRLPAITKLAVYEPPLVVDSTRPAMPDGYTSELEALVAAGRRGDAVKMFMRFVGTPAIFIAVLPVTPVWPKLKAVAHTLPYDLGMLAGYQRGEPLDPAEWAAVKVPVLVADGGKSPVWMRNGTSSLAAILPDARHQTIPGQTHMVKPEALVPVLTEFYEVTGR